VDLSEICENREGAGRVAADTVRHKTGFSVVVDRRLSVSWRGLWLMVDRRRNTEDRATHSLEPYHLLWDSTALLIVFDMSRYVILMHDHPFLHWDLMLEDGNVLRTWRLLQVPAAGRTAKAEQLADHRLAYLDYEGPVSGGRGNVARWDHGTYDAIVAGRFDCLRLHGTRDLAIAELASGIEGVSWTFHGIEHRKSNLADATSSDSAESTPVP
jgi:hypothetical protein